MDSEINKMDIKEIQAIDFMLMPYYFMPEQTKEAMKYWEWRVMFMSTFGGVVKKMGLKEGEEWKVFTAFGKPSLEDTLAEMDEVGVERAIMPAASVWSQRDHGFMMDYSIDSIGEVVKKSKGRIIGGANYNPFRIKESLDEIEKGVKEYGFKYVWFHPISFGLRPDDRRCYPLYVKCLELDITVGLQVGHSAEPLTSEPGHPMNVDNVAIDFPDLRIILTHTGWPWIDEWCSMIWRHPNVYGGINAYYPSALYPATVQFMDSPRGQDKVLWGSHGFGITRCKKEFLELPISDKTKRKVLRDNAIKAFKL